MHCTKVWHTLEAVVLAAIRITTFRKICLAGRLAAIATIPPALRVIQFCAAKFDGAGKISVPSARYLFCHRVILQNEVSSRRYWNTPVHKPSNSLLCVQSCVPKQKRSWWFVQKALWDPPNNQECEASGMKFAPTPQYCSKLVGMWEEASKPHENTCCFVPELSQGSPHTV